MTTVYSKNPREKRMQELERTIANFQRQNQEQGRVLAEEIKALHVALVIDA